MEGDGNRGIASVLRQLHEPRMECGVHNSVYFEGDRVFLWRHMIRRAICLHERKSCRAAYRRIERREGERELEKRRIERIRVDRSDDERTGLTGLRESKEAKNILLLV